MKRRRQIALCGIGISLMCLLPAYLPGLLPIPAPKLTRSSFEPIKSGSTIADIKSLLAPPRIRVANRCVVWVPQDGTLVSAFVSGKEDLPCFSEANTATGYQMGWLDESGLIAGWPGQIRHHAVGDDVTGKWPDDARIGKGERRQVAALQGKISYSRMSRTRADGD